MSLMQEIKQHIAELINNILVVEKIEETDLMYPPQVNMGDLCLPCFNLAKLLKKNPAETADWLVGEIDANRIIAGVKSVGPYLNFNIDKQYLAEQIIKKIVKDSGDYGKNDCGKKKKVMIEYSNVNTHKEYHVGHLRNISYGDAVNKILSVNGYEAVPISYINDFGIHVAKTLWNFEKFMTENYGGVGEKNLPKDKSRGFVLGKMYVDASKRAKEDKMAKQMIGGFMKKIESRQGTEYELWQKTRQWSIDQFAGIYKDLGVEFVDTLYENDFVEEGRKMVDELLEKNILIKSQGAIIADLEEYGLGVLVVIRSDGTSQYPVADLALARAKFERFNLDKSIYVVDIRQELYFKQLFKVLSLIGYEQKMIHLGYDFVKLPTGMMSSRDGNVITYEELKEEILQKVKKETSKRHPDWAEEKINDVVRKIAFGAIKFEMIKVGAKNVITFDIETALRFEGFTSAYLQYTYARTRSIIEKADVKIDFSKVNYAKLDNIKEANLTLKIAKYPEIVKRAGDCYDPSEIARYVFELAQMFNDYYHSVSVLKADETTKNARLALLESVSQVIKNSLALLGVEVMEEM